ncbi:fluoride efflux transporter CrcB [Actinocorallia populi]|uniref:fluoride efflux transporter CrcB n=1 Tax=Actinocorallia populi TaxID=2079200 RepID=UPI0018E4FB8A|nr:fluoride efflux transporter CrcB [Actinocorallia populi]
MEDSREAGGRLLHREKAEASALDRNKTGPPRHPGMHSSAFLDIAVGGAIGALLRYLITEAMPGAKSGFPWGTLLVNVLACLLMGLLTTYLLKGRPHPSARLFLVTGYLGGFSTFSHLIDGIDALARAGSWGLSVTYAVVSVLGGLIAVAAGLRLGGMIPHPADRSGEGRTP